MVSFDFTRLSAPVSDADPCGPDLELADDPEFMQFVARAEGLLPTSFFAFDRSSIDFDAERATAAKLLEASRDLRLIAILAKLSVLNGDLAGFTSSVEGMARLLSEQWDNLHPRGDDGDFGLRMAVLQSLDDGPPVVLPLQHLALVQSRRHGPISFRSYLVAAGEVKPREEEPVLDRTAVEGAFMEAELPRLVETRDRLKTLSDALAGIRATCIAQAGYDQAVSFDKLPPAVDRMLALVDGFVVKRDPSAAPKAASPAEQAAAPAGAVDKIRSYLDGRAAQVQAEAGGQPGSASAVASTEDAAAALAAAAAYFGRFEPSNPAVLLIRQAEQLMGKSFLEVMRILMPAQAEQATIHIGGAQTFDLPVERLSALAAEALPEAEADVAVESEAADETAADAEAGDETSDEAGVEAGVEERPEPNGAARASNGAGRPGFAVRRRDDALALLLQVGDYYRAVEPSSPIPLLTERALSLAQSDFLSLLKDLLPEAPKPDEVAE